MIVCVCYPLRSICLHALFDSCWRWLDLSYPHGDDLHYTAAMRATDRWFGLGLPGFRQHDSQQQVHQLQQLLAVAMQQAVVPGAPEALGQHMAQQHPQEVRPRHALDLLRTAVVADAIGDQSIAITEDVFLKEHTAVEVAP